MTTLLRGATTVSRLLRHPNPQFRYAGVLAADPGFYDRELYRALLSERSHIVRQRLARKLGQSPDPPDTSDLVRMIALEDSAAFIEMLIETGRIPTEANLSEAIKILGLVCKDSREELALLLANGPGPAAGVLARGVEEGLDSSLPSDLRILSGTRVQDVLTLLSPFDEGGLGTCDELHVIGRIDRLFLFFSQIRYFLERDLSSGNPAP